jgi:hypothetical protein
MNGVLVYRGGPSLFDAGLSAVLRQVYNRHEKGERSKY